MLSSLMRLKRQHIANFFLHLPCYSGTLTTTLLLAECGALAASVVAATHRRHDAVVIAMLCLAPVSVSGSLDSGYSGGLVIKLNQARYKDVQNEFCKVPESLEDDKLNKEDEIEDPGSG
ncbi:hypothetical protein RIF29_16568 [Crotalaria pallida]|uniref:Uncharacterized protein n=1 Tax=Crotalaria pallida TaxID=3830 RepID=A0AAN9FHK9_CROPI